MPALVAPFLAKAAIAAPALPAVVAPAATGIGAAAAQTAALELAKQQAIQAGMKQVGTEAVKQAGIEATKQAGVEAAKQSAVEASKQGIAQGFQKMIPQAADDVAAATQGGTGYSGYSKVFGPQPPAPYGGPTPPPVSAPPAPAPAGPLPPAGGGGTPLAFKDAAGLGNAPPAPELTQGFMPKSAPFKDPGTFSRVMSSEPSMSKLMTSPVDELAGLKPAEFPLAPKSALRQGAEDALKWMGDNKLETGLGLMTAGQYLNKPKEKDKDEYKNTVDMSEFRASEASVPKFNPSYEYQKYAAEGGLMGYAMGGPVETMSAQNAVGANQAYPQAGLQNAMYSNPIMQRPMPTNVVSQGYDTPTDPYTGEQKFAKGGDISDEMAREYGLKSRKQRATKSLTQSYEEMQAERDKQAASLLNERSGPGIIRRSRTQELSSPFEAAKKENQRLFDKHKVPVAQMPKTSLGDIDTYMETPIEAASGGIMGNLGGYSDGGRLLKGPGDGVSDSIPAVIGKRQPARLADGEFVIPARIVSELGNGSTEAGARKLYAMMERVQRTRKKSIGKKKVAVNSRADKHLPA